MADESDESLSTEYDRIPTHILVQKQMQDLIALQKSRVARLENDLTAQNETLTSSYVSKDQYETELGRLQAHWAPTGTSTLIFNGDILLKFMTSLLNDYVPRDQYTLAVSQLEEEKLEHAETRLRLREVTEKLKKACEQIQNLKLLLETEKKTHDKTRSSLKSKNVQETAKTIKLQTKCSEISKQCEKQEEILSAKNEEIYQLELRVKAQEELYKKEMTEAEIERKQQRYIAKMIEEQDRKKIKTMPQAVPKTKFTKR